MRSSGIAKAFGVVVCFYALAAWFVGTILLVYLAYVGAVGDFIDHLPFRLASIIGVVVAIVSAVASVIGGIHLLRRRISN